MRIEDYALIGDLETSALVGRNGSVDWLCLPRFDSASCFTALLGEEKHGRWLIAPAGEVRSVSRRYREGTLVLETDFETADGTVRVIDFMPPREGGAPQLVRIVQGLRGRVPMRMQLIIRFGYGLNVPWVERVPDGLVAQVGPDAVHLSTRRRDSAVRISPRWRSSPSRRVPANGSSSAGSRPTRALAALRTLTRRWPAPRRGGGSGRAGAAMAVRTATRS